MYGNIVRRNSKKLKVGNLFIGEKKKILVQSMTSTTTSKIKETILQINNLKSLGAEIIRVSIPSIDASKSFIKIKKKPITL